VFFLAPPPPDNLINSLFRDAECLGETSSALTRFISCSDLFITFRLRFGWEWGVVEHLHNVKRRQPDVEASCGFEPLWGTEGHGLLHRLRQWTSHAFVPNIVPLRELQSVSMAHPALTNAQISINRPL
jgi:hypothetical protein